MLLAIVNPISGRANAARYLYELNRNLKAVLESLGALHEQLNIIETDREGSWHQAAARIVSDSEKSDREPLVFVFGGDGTLSQVAQWANLLPRAVCLFFVPAGRGNDFSRGFYRLESGVISPVQFWEWTLRQTWRESFVDLGKCNEFSFLNMVSIGYGAQVVENVHQRKAIWSKTSLVYQIEGALALLGCSETNGIFFKNRNAGEDLKEQVYQGHFFGAFLGNGPLNGGGLHWFEKGSYNDGKLELGIFRKPSFLEMLRVLKAAKRGKAPEQFFSAQASDSCYQMKFDRPVPFETDGEYRGRTTQISISTFESKIKVMAPKFILPS